MLCPEITDGELGHAETKEDATKVFKKKSRKSFTEEGPGSLELNSFKNPKTWKKTISKFFRSQIRSTRSNDGDIPSGSIEKFEEKELSPEQKWQSLGKMFRRQTLIEHWNKSPNPEGSSSHKRSHAVKKVLSSYFGKIQRSLPIPDQK